RDRNVTGVQTCALPISPRPTPSLVAALGLEVLPGILNLNVKGRVFEAADIAVEPLLNFLRLIRLSQRLVLLGLVLGKTWSSRDHHCIGQLSFGIFFNNQRVSGLDLDI